jgi:two-component system, chemotaxis family, response regulator Rcp1
MDGSGTENLFKILIIEDNPGDVRLMQEALREGNVNCLLRVAADGVEALSQLRSREGAAEFFRPDLIFLDLNVPKKDGREVLAELKGDSSLRRIPVIVLTTSAAEQDILKAYDLHANCYITKPVDLEQFLNAMKLVRDFWFTIAKLPQE